MMAEPRANPPAEPGNKRRMMRFSFPRVVRGGWNSGDLRRGRSGNAVRVGHAKQVVPDVRLTISECRRDQVSVS